MRVTEAREKKEAEGEKEKNQKSGGTEGSGKNKKTKAGNCILGFPLANQPLCCGLGGGAFR